MAVNCKIIKDFNRPHRELVELFRGMSTANIDDTMERMAAIASEIVPIGKGQLLGTAFTIRMPAGDNLMLHAAMDIAKPGDVLVIDAGGYENRAIFGELMATYCRSRGICGIVCDGAVRDRAQLSALENFPVYARATSPNGPYKNGPGEINVPISIGGVWVSPGDIVVGDSDGVLILHPQDAEQIAAATRQVAEKEKLILDGILEKGRYERPWVDEILQRMKCEMVNFA